MSHPELSFPDLRSLKMYRSIWKAFFVLFFKPCLSTCFCLFKYSYCFYLILSHLTYKRKQMCMQTEIIISLMYSLTLRETLLCWLWMPWLRTSAGSAKSLITNECLVCLCMSACVCVCVCLEERPKKWGGKKSKVMNLRDCRKFHICYLRWHSCTFLWTLWMSNWNVCGWGVHVNTCRQNASLPLKSNVFFLRGA